MLALEGLDIEVNKASKITEDMELEEVKSDGKSTWHIAIYKLCPNAHVPVYSDHMVIAEPLAPKVQTQRLYCGSNYLFWVT